MRISKLKVMVGACACWLLAISAAADTRGANPPGSGISIESWLSENGRDLPVLSFDSAFGQGALADDIRVENIIRDKDGSTRYLLSHTGPLSRQVFASVHSVAQEDGFTRSIITNHADGGQTEYLSRTADLPVFIERGTISHSGVPVKTEKTDDQETECLSCIVIISLAIACVVQENRSYQLCEDTCQGLGGIKYFDPGTCGSVSSECACMDQPRRTATDF